MRDRTINLIGWRLFVLSAIGFIVSSLRGGDVSAPVGGLVFLMACLVFLIPFMRRSR